MAGQPHDSGGSDARSPGTGATGLLTWGDLPAHVGIDSQCRKTQQNAAHFLRTTPRCPDRTAAFTYSIGFLAAAARLLADAARAGEFTDCLLFAWPLPD